MQVHNNGISQGCLASEKTLLFEEGRETWGFSKNAKTLDKSGKNDMNLQGNKKAFSILDDGRMV